MVPSDDAHTFILERQYTEVEVIQGNLITFQTPIKKKFEYIKGWEGDGESGEVEGLTEDDIKKVDTLDEAWRTFLIGMQEANGIITRNFQEQKQEMESQISDLKGDVTENLKTFQKECPRAIESKSSADLEETRKA